MRTGCTCRQDSQGSRHKPCKMGRSLGSPLDGHAALKDLGRIVSEMSNMKPMMREMARSARLKQQEDAVPEPARGGAGEA